MVNAQLHGVLRYLGGLHDTQAITEASDAQLLERFAAGHEEAPFTALVRRHGPMVWGVARRVLAQIQDAEDVFQATFLLLARKAASIRKAASVGSWLHGVAHRLALKARQQQARRRAREQRAAHMRQTNPVGESPLSELLAALDGALGELPEKYRAVLVLCYLEGRTHEEAARRLGCPLATVRTRVARGRKLLRDRLAKHGLTLSTAGLAALLIASAAPAAAPAALVKTAVGAALAFAAGQSAAALCSTQAAGLVHEGLQAMSLTKLKTLTVLFLAVGLVATGAGMLAHQEVAGREPPAENRKSKVRLPDPPTAAAKQTAAPAEADDGKDPFPVTGRVLDPDGKPVAGAKLYVLYYTPKLLPVPVRATTTPDGRFRFDVARADFDRAHSAQPWDLATVVAVADGYGLGGLPHFEFGPDYRQPDLTLQLARDDVPITGRLLDLQGQPLAGVIVRVQGLHTPQKGDLTAFLQQLKGANVFYPAVREHLTGFEGGWMGRDIGRIFPLVVTGADGRFTLKGVGRERLVTLRLEGPTVATAEVYAVTRPGGSVAVSGSWGKGDTTPPILVRGAAFDQVLAPCKPITGVVRDQDSGKPIAGAIVTSYQLAGDRISERTHLRTTADAQGRYRLTGLPKGQGNVIRAAPPEGQPYLMSLRRVADTPGLEPVVVDFKLRRGVWITGRVFDKVTGKPVHSHIEYAVFEDNPHAKEVAGLTFDSYLDTRAADGSFRFVGLPGRGLLGARAWGDRYVLAFGADRIKGRDANGFFRTNPHLMIAENFHALVEVSPAKESEAVTCDVALDPGRTLTGTVQDPDGKPLAGVRVRGLNDYGYWENVPLKTAEFTLTGLKPGVPRLLEFAHAEQKLAGSLVVRGNEQGPLTVKLVPAGCITGRLVTPLGEPVSDGEILALQAPPMAQPGAPKRDLTRGSFPRGIRPDKEGRFRLEGLAPGLTYQFGLLVKGTYLNQLRGEASGPLTVKPGETKNLGAVTVKKGDE